MARQTINGISVPIPGTGEPPDFVADLRRIATDLSASLESTVPVTRFGAVGDGVTDDTAAIQAALAAHTDVYIPAGTWLISSTLTVRPGCTLRGAGSSNYFVQGEADPDFTQVIIASDTATTGIVVGGKGNLAELMVLPENFAAHEYDLSTVPDQATTGNASIGVVLEDCAQATRINVRGFYQYGIHAKTTTQLFQCFASMCDIGFYLDGADGWMLNSIAMFNYTAGVDVNGNYWRYTSCRFEWNARYGLKAGGESTITGCLFDRNGWAGLLLKSGAWGHATAGNYFSRNGCGGNGTVGRWGFSVPAHRSYVATSAAKSCHIEIAFQRAVAIAGNRFRAGRDDAEEGANAPLYIFSSQDADGTTGAAHVVTAGNAGVVAGADGLGYTQGDYSTATPAAIAGGTDAALARFLNSRVPPSPYRNAAGPTTSVTVDVPNHRPGGQVRLTIRAFDVAATATVHFAINAVSGGHTAAFENHIGSAVTAASFSAHPTDTTLNRVTITLAASCFYDYTVAYHDAL